MSVFFWKSDDAFIKTRENKQLVRLMWPNQPRNETKGLISLRLVKIT